jgi:hypothetical protein
MCEASLTFHGAISNKKALRTSPGIRIREHIQISIDRRGSSRCGLSRSGGSLRCACSSARRRVSTAPKLHSSFIGKRPINLAEFRILSVISQDQCRVSNGNNIDVELTEGAGKVGVSSYHHKPACFIIIRLAHHDC